MSTLGPKDRLSVITFENGVGGVIRKTPFLAVGRDGEGKRRVLELIDTIGNEYPDAAVDKKLIVLDGSSKEEKADVVSAVNVGQSGILFSVLQFFFMCGSISTYMSLVDEHCLNTFLFVRFGQ